MQTLLHDMQAIATMRSNAPFATAGLVTLAAKGSHHERRREPGARAALGAARADLVRLAEALRSE